ncbi:MAG: RHS repeat-associated core domain-containing protein, partial [Terriglobales bacterium]
TWYEPTGTDKGKFTSYERDSGAGETGLDYGIFRHYSSGLARFMSVDLMAGSLDAPQSLNRYGYVGNDPVNMIDPTGLLTVPSQVCTFIPSTRVTSTIVTTGQKSPGMIRGMTTCTWVTFDSLDPFSGPSGPANVGGGNSPIDRLPAAIQKALEALNNPDCASTVGQGSKDGKSVRAADVLRDLASNVQVHFDGNTISPHYGVITFDALKSPPGTTMHATTHASYSSSGGGPSIAFVTITINTAAGVFVSGSLQAEAAAVLHELAHAMGLLFGAGATAIKKDSETTPEGIAQSQANNKLIEDKCFKKKP